jgi:hypothetical protein
MNIKEKIKLDNIQTLKRYNMPNIVNVQYKQTGRSKSTLIQELIRNYG